MVFSEIKKNFGFGCMRLPMKDGNVDYDKFNSMIDYFIDNGFNYFDTAHGYIDGKRFGFNIGYGFGNTTRATENMIFYDGKCHKLDKIYFDIPENIMQPWGFLSSDGRFNMRFVPVYDNSSHVSAFLLSRSAHQVFGKMSGSAVLDDGTVLKIKDLTVFAEKVMNRN